MAIAMRATPGHVDTDVLHCPDAEHTIMVVPEPIERPDVSWYSPFMETVQPSSNTCRDEVSRSGEPLTPKNVE